jgi:hypothetical protein
MRPALASSMGRTEAVGEEEQDMVLSPHTLVDDDLSLSPEMPMFLDASRTEVTISWR